MSAVRADVIAPVGGAQVETLLREIYASPREVVKLATELVIVDDQDTHGKTPANAKLMLIGPMLDD